MQNSLTIKDWDDADKPREKLLAQGKKHLTNAELIAILLGSGIRGKSAVDLAKEILKKSTDDLTPLIQMEATDFMKFKGVGEARAITLIAALELGRRMTDEKAHKKEIYITNSQDLYNYIHTDIDDLCREHFVAIYLNVRGKVVGTECISAGGLTTTPVDIRLIFKYALEKNAVAVAVAHNHPSGSTSPSEPDRQLTQRIKEAGKILNINLIEHIIVGAPNGDPTNYFSFADNGLL